VVVKSLIVIDVETTGKERSRDQVIELCVQDGLVGGESRTWRFKPSCPIHPEALATHGITEDSLAACPTFADNATAMRALLDGADIIVGYNVRFDLDMLQAELERAGLPLIDLTAKLLVDPMRLWQHFEPRTLAAAHEKFLGEPLVDAHAASIDVAATGLVLEAMLKRFDLDGADWAAIAKLADPLPERRTWFGPSNHLKWQNGEVVVAFGKYSGTPLHRIDSGFLNWVLRQDFPQHVKEACRMPMRLAPAAFLEWARAQHPPPAPIADAA
jgi:DNA polymerase-3 subunit epsilon